MTSDAVKASQRTEKVLDRPVRLSGSWTESRVPQGDLGLPQLSRGEAMLFLLRASVALATGVLGTTTASACPDVAAPRIEAHFDITAGQQPENLVVEPDGAVDLTFAFARQIVRRGADGRLRVLATLPEPAPGTSAPITGSPFLSGITRTPDGSLYVVYSAGTADLTGLWRLRPGTSAAQRVAALPADTLPNGLAFHDGQFYVTDSAHPTVWRIPLATGTATAWATGDALGAPAGAFGANGIKVRDGAVWVTDTSSQTLLRIPITPDGHAGPTGTAASGIGPVDDFSFLSDGSALLAVNSANTVIRLRLGQSPQVVLTASDGLQNPTSIAVRGDRFYVSDSAYSTGRDPNLLSASW
jgi:hypothetical protein